MHYVIGDVHGCFKEMTDLLKKIEKKDSEAEIIFVGDFIDRGSAVWDVLLWAMDHITEDGKYQSVVGNHEDMVIEWYEKQFLPWWEAGGFQSRSRMPETYFDFSKWLDAVDCLTPGKLERIILFFKSLPFEKKIAVSGIDYRIVHGWYADKEPDYGKRRYLSIWTRHNSGNTVTNEVIIHGHTPTIAPNYALPGTRPGLIGYEKNAINVDGGCCFGGQISYPCMLCAICLETLEEIYPYTLEERFRMLAGVPLTEMEAQKMVQDYERDFPGENDYRNMIEQRLNAV